MKIDGEVLYNGENIYGKDVDVTRLRKQIGMVFQKANPFPMSIYDNIAYGPRTHGIRGKARLDDIVEALPARRGHLGRGQGSPEQERARPLRRPAAEALHSPRPRRGAGHPAHGREHQRPRPHLHQQDRRPCHGAEKPLYCYHGHTQYAAGSACVRQDRVFPSRRAG